MKIFVVLFALYLCKQNLTSNLRIAHYANVTLRSCGLNSLTAKLAHKKCFKWHQTIIDEQKALKAIKYGRYAETGEFPHTVLIRSFNGTGKCTGSVINGFWVITAAHCLKGDTQIYAGITDYIERSTPYIKASKIFPHEKYVKGRNFHDIGLIKLQKEIQININRANGVCLPDTELKSLETGELATVTGWGAINETETNTKRLKMTQIRLGDVYYDKTSMFITTYTLKYGYTCPGDSGGPLLQYVNGRAVQIGVVRGSVRNSTICSQSESILFTAVPYYISWIIDKIRNN